MREKGWPKKEFELVQQTPMIHFQRNQIDACIRGSDIKPKLDKFIIAWMQKDKREIPDSWILSREEDGNKQKEQKNPALKYKVSINTCGNTPDLIDKNEFKGIYFGNEGGIFYKKPVKLIVICMIPALCEVIDTCIELFFLVHNFGTRSRRGLGCFIVKDTTAAKAEEFLCKWYEGKDTTIFKMDYSNVKNTGKDNLWILKDASFICDILKSGKNDRNGYIKSYLTKYFLQSGIYGEKRCMKAMGVAPALGKSRNSSGVSVDNSRYIRGLFGISNAIEYIDNLENHGKKPVYNKKKNAMVDTVIKDTIVISSHPLNKDDMIDRIPSPLLFAVVEKVLFIIAFNPFNTQNGDLSIAGSAFRFSCQQNIKKYGNKDNFDFKPEAPIILRIPASDEFDMAAFMQEFSLYISDAQISGTCPGEISLKQYNANSNNQLLFVTESIAMKKCQEVE